MDVKLSLMAHMSNHSEVVMPWYGPGSFLGSEQYDCLICLTHLEWIAHSELGWAGMGILTTTPVQALVETK